MFGDNEVDVIIDGALDVLGKVGLHIGSKRILDMIGDQDNARIQGDRAFMGRDLVESCLKTAPPEIRVFPQNGPDPPR